MNMKIMLSTSLRNADARRRDIKKSVSMEDYLDELELISKAGEPRLDAQFEASHPVGFVEELLYRKYE